MNTTELFDVVIVYDGEIASGASDATYHEHVPFSNNSDFAEYNRSYEYFLTYCEQLGIRAAFASTEDITATGLLKAVWVYDNNWKRLHKTVGAKVIFDKFSNQETYNAKFKARLRANPKGVRYFHNARIREIFDNKLKTYVAFSEYAIPTVKINLDTEAHITFAKNKLGTALTDNNFTEIRNESFVLKDKYGSGGNNVFKINTHTKLKPIGKRDESISYVLQPFIAASGFIFTDYSGNIDLRVIVCNGEIMQCYIRIPKQNEFRANASQGGAVVYIDIDKIPADVVTMAKAINADLPVQDGFYALDFIKSSTGHLYFIEGNSTPGLNWYTAEDEQCAKQLMRTMIKKMKTMLRT